MSEVRKGRAEINHREWVEFEFTLDAANQIQEIAWRAWGCHHLVEAAERAALTMKGTAFDDLHWTGPGRSLEHWDLLVNEAFARAKGTFKIPVDDPETCHCRKIPTARVDEAIVLGAHTPERVTAWTTASSGCGTCRPVVEQIIAYRLKKAA